jgi:hypothetical protein
MQFYSDISNFFSKDEINNTAKEIGFVVRKSPINGFNFMLTFTTGLLNTPESTLLQLATFLNSISDTNISPQALYERINDKAVELVKFFLSKALKFSLEKVDIPNNILSEFSHIWIIDSTNFNLHPSLKEKYKGSSGSASESAMRIQLLYDYLSGKTHIVIGDTKTSDSKTLYNIIENDTLCSNGKSLFLQDLGYFKNDSFCLLDKSEEFFASRLKSNVKVFDPAGNKIDILQILKKEKPEFIEMNVKIGNLECRLLGNRLPQETVKIKIKKAIDNAIKKGRQVTQDYKIFLTYVFLILISRS